MELHDGTQKSVRVENLCPLEALPLEAPTALEKEEPEAKDVEEKEELSVRQRVRLEPSRLPVGGGEVELEVDDLDGAVGEVWVDGNECEVLSRGKSTLVRVPARAGGGGARWFFNTEDIQYVSTCNIMYIYIGI